MHTVSGLHCTGYNVFTLTVWCVHVDRHEHIQEIKEQTLNLHHQLRSVHPVNEEMEFGTERLTESTELSTQTNRTALAVVNDGLEIDQ